MASFEERLEKACKDLEIPGAVLVGGSADGKFRYEKTFGVRSLKNPSPLKIDDTMWLASCTKLMTTVATMQCVERGQLKLDEDVTTILPELNGREILTGFEEDTGKPILVPNTKPITLRQMLTHQSGLGYDLFNPTLQKYRAYQKREFGLKNLKTQAVAEANDFPLLFEPGAAWEYSVGLDWAGEMVSRVNGNITLDAYLEQNVWGPLGMKSNTFFPESKPAVLEKLVDMSKRDCGITMFGTAENPDAKVVYSEDSVWVSDIKHCHGGAGGYGSVLDYQKLLQSICANDGKVLKPASVDEMFKPQLTDAARAALNQQRAIPAVNDVFGGMPQGFKVDWGISGIINLESFPGRSAGSMAWGGLPNLLWWIDRTSGMSGILGTQMIPPGDSKVAAWNLDWAKEMYERAGVKQKL